VLLEISLKIKAIGCCHRRVGCEGKGKQPRNNSKSRPRKLRLYFGRDEV
jgi:hypothetical protein